MLRQTCILLALGISGSIVAGPAIAQESSGLNVQELSQNKAAALNQNSLKAPTADTSNVSSTTAPTQSKTYWLLQQSRTFPEVWSEGPDLPAYRAFFTMLEQGLAAREQFHEVLPLAQKMSGLSDANLVWLSRRLAGVGALFNREYLGAESSDTRQADGYWLLKQGRMFPNAWADGPDLPAYRAFFAHLAESKEGGLAFPSALSLAQKLSGVSDANLVWLTQRLASAGR
jgi:hypothetical protein